MKKSSRGAKKSTVAANGNPNPLSFNSSVAIIDDLESNRTFLEFLARRLPEIRSVQTFSSARQALEGFAAAAPDLIITDFNMPGMNAVEFLEALRRMSGFEDLPVIVVSSHNESENRRQVLNAGATDFLMVPFDTFEFQARTRNLLRLSLHQKQLKTQSLSLKSELLETRSRSKRTQDRFTSIIDSVPALVFAVNASGECVFANRYCFNFLKGQEGEECSAQFLADKIARTAPFDADHAQLEPSEILLTGEDGRERTFLIVPKAVSDANHSQDLIVYSGIEISQLKETERSLRKAKDDAEAANRANSAFLSNMTHEIRTPLNAIIGFTDMICNELYGPINNEKYRSYLHDVRSSATHLLAVINEILDFSQIEARRHTTKMSRFSLRDCLKEIRNLVKPQVDANGNWLQLKDILDLTIYTDRQKLNQVFLNIITNANKATRNGIIRVSAEREISGDLVVTVSDNGVGMDENELELAVTEFGRVSTSAFVSDGQVGTGLGLPISIGFMKLLGGSLELRSKKAVGTTARITLPASAVISEKESSSQEPSPEAGAAVQHARREALGS